VLIVEGEKCADAAATVFPDWVVVTSCGGCKAASKTDWSALEGRRVVIWPDADEEGRGYAESVAALVEHIAADIRIVDPSPLACSVPGGGLKKGYDVVDALDEGWTLSELRARVLESATVWEKGDPSDAPSIDPVDEITTDPTLARALRELALLKTGDYALKRKEEAKRLGLSVATLDGFVRRVRDGEQATDRELPQRDILLELAQDAELWRDPVGEAFATVTEGQARKTYRVRSGDFKSWLIRCWMAHFDDGGLVSEPHPFLPPPKKENA